MSAIIKGTVPLYTPGNANLFAKHWRLRPTTETNDAGESIQTGFLALNQGSFNLYELCGATGTPKGVYMDALLYADEGDMAQVLPLQNHAPCTGNEFHIVTKVLGKRWGVKLTIDQASGVVSLKGDYESPVIGVKLRLA